MSLTLLDGLGPNLFIATTINSQAVECRVCVRDAEKLKTCYYWKHQIMNYQFEFLLSAETNPCPEQDA